MRAESRGRSRDVRIPRSPVRQSAPAVAGLAGRDAGCLLAICLDACVIGDAIAARRITFHITSFDMVWDAARASTQGDALPANSQRKR